MVEKEAENWPRTHRLLKHSSVSAGRRIHNDRDHTSVKHRSSHEGFLVVMAFKTVLLQVLRTVLDFLLTTTSEVTTLTVDIMQPRSTT